jgi:hypothetical protein
VRVYQGRKGVKVETISRKEERESREEGKMQERKDVEEGRKEGRNPGRKDIKDRGKYAKEGRKDFQEGR